MAEMTPDVPQVPDVPKVPDMPTEDALTREALEKVMKEIQVKKLPESTGRYVGIDLGISCVVASSLSDDRFAVTVCTNDVSGRSTPAAISYNEKLRHIGMSAEGRIMKAPKQTLTHLPLVFGSHEALQQRADRFHWLFPLPTEDLQLGPFAFNGEQLVLKPCGPLGALLRMLTSYASSGEVPFAEIVVGVYDYYSDEEIAVVRDALDVAGFSSTSLIRHSDAVVAAFVHGASSGILSEGLSERIVAFVDVGVSHATVSVVKFVRLSESVQGVPSEAVRDVAAEFLYRQSNEMLGVQSFIGVVLKEVCSRIEQRHKCTVEMRSKAGMRLEREVVHALKQLSMLPDAEISLEAFQPEGGEGPEFDISVPFNRDAFEVCAAGPLGLLKAMLTEALAAAPDGVVDSVELIGGGSRIPAVQALVKQAVGEAPLRFGLDSASCVATGAAAWAAGRRVVPAVTTEMTGLGHDDIAAVKEVEQRVEDVHCAEVKRFDKRNSVESYAYQVRDWMNGANGELLNSAVLNPFLDAAILWLEDADMAEEVTSYEVYAAKLQEMEDFVRKEGALFFEKRAQDLAEQEKSLEKAAEEERERRRTLGMDNDKDERRMKKEDRLRLAGKNKDEGNDMFKAQKFDDAVRRYKKAIDHVSRPECESNLTPQEAEDAKKIKVSCHLNSAQCYLKAAETALSDGGKNAAEPFYKKAKVSCDDVLDLDSENIKAMYRRGLCWEKLGELDTSMKDIKKALKMKPDDVDLKKSAERLERLTKKQKEGQKKVFSKMFG